MGMLFDAESGEYWFSPAHDVHVLEGVAAGDAFDAGFVHALINDFDPQDAVNYADAASILKLTIKGDSNLVTADEIAAVASSRRWHPRRALVRLHSAGRSFPIPSPAARSPIPPAGQNHPSHSSFAWHSLHDWSSSWFWNCLNPKQCLR